MDTVATLTEAPERGGRYAVGVHFDRETLRLVTMHQDRIVEWASVPYPSGLTVTSPEFPAFLKQALDRKIHGLHHAPLWVSTVFHSLQVRFLAVPRTRASQLSNTVYWTFRREIPFDAAQTIFDYGAEGDVSEEGGARKLAVTAYTVARTEVEQYRQLFERAGLNLAGIVIPCFAIQNLTRLYSAELREKTIVTLLVTDESSSTLIQSEGHVMLNRVFQAGMNTLVDALRGRWPELNVDQARACVRWAGGAAAAAPSFELPTDRDGLLHVLGGALEHIVQQVERSMSAYLVGRSGEEIQGLYVMGEMAEHPRFIEIMESHLGLKVAPFKLMLPQHFAGHAAAPPPDPGRWALALGAAGSRSSRTPNLLHTYVERDKARRTTRWNMAAIVCGVVGVLSLLIGFQYVRNLNGRLRRELAESKARLAQYAPHPDRATITHMAAKARERHQRARALAAESLPLAALNEVALLTPPEIRLSAVRCAAVDEKTAARQAAKGATGPRHHMQVEGHVGGARGEQEARLAFYVLQLQNSPLFENAEVRKADPSEKESEQALRFHLELTVCPGGHAQAAAGAKTAGGQGL